MSNQSADTRGQLQITLDGSPVDLPSERRSLSAIRSYLETLALERQRIVAAFTVDGRPATAQIMDSGDSFSRVEAETVNLEELPLQFLRTALQQSARSLERAQSAVTLVLINDSATARECWWNLAKELKEPLLTLSLLPDDICKLATCGASMPQLRKWQLAQLARIIRNVDETCHAEDTFHLSTALEIHVIPWLKTLHETIALWHDAVTAGARLAARG